MVKIGPSFYRHRSMPPGLSTPAPLKCALLIGINYTRAEPDESEYPPLHRAQADTRDFRALLISA